MKKCMSLISATLLLVAAARVDAALVISEVLYNELGSDTGGEWIEIYNSGPADIDLSNYKIGDEETSGGTGTTEGMFHFPVGASIGSHEVQIIAGSVDRFNEVYGFLPTYEVQGTNATVANLTVYSAWDPDGNQLNMSNSNDQALILGPSDEIVDALSWGGTFAFDPGLNADAEADGQSYERINALVDTNTPADWRLGNPSSPGVVNVVPEPASFILGAIAFYGLISPRRRSKI
jgi:hypothetical protein